MKNLFLVFYFFSFSISAMPTENYSFKRCQLKYYIEVVKNVPKVELITLIPQSIENTQEIVSIDYSILPKRVFKKDNHTYAEFVIENPKRKNVVIIDFFIKIFPNDLTHRKKSPNPTKDEDFSMYLQSENHIESDSERIQTIAKSLKRKSDVKTVKQIFKYVRNKFSYKAQKVSFGALKASYAATGDCSEYSDLFVALCRANNIPAKRITGYNSPFGSGANLKGEKLVAHAWAEVYLNNIGWVTFEPTKGYKYDFRETTNNYVQISSLRNLGWYRCTYKGKNVKTKFVFVSS